MSEANIGECKCDDCLQPSTHPSKELHRWMKLFLSVPRVYNSRLDEQQKRWYVALESEKIGRGGDKLMAQISGIHVETIRRGRRELDTSLEGRPIERVRLQGGGRPLVEKKIQR